MYVKKVITYGTFDLLHYGHINLLKRAKELGDYLIVGVTTENYDDSRGKLNVQQSLMERIENVKKTGLADEIIIEEYEGQKINDILKYDIDIFAIGSDWLGKFDYIKEYCEVIYLERTKGISSTKIRNESNSVIKLGIVGYGRIASRFIIESKFVSGVNVEGVFGLKEKSVKDFMIRNELEFYSLNYDDFLEKVDAVYIATPHITHYNYAKLALEKNKHVLCEKPITLSKRQTTELYNLAKEKKLVILEAIKTAYAPGFIRLISVAKSGLIGEIKNIDATFTKLIEKDDKYIREFDKEQGGGSVTELASYPLLAIVKLLGNDIKDTNFFSYMDKDNEVDMFTKINIVYKTAIATAKVGLGVKSEGDLIISGTKGYIYVPAPWWKTEYFEIRFENGSYNKRHYCKFEGDGLRYELAEFISMIHKGKVQTYKLNALESETINGIIEVFLNKENTTEI